MPEQKETSSGSKRQSLRLRASLSGRYMLADGRESMCKVIDVSARGIALDASVKGAIGERVVLYLDEIGRLQGRIVRHMNGGFAVQLDATAAGTKRVAKWFGDLFGKSGPRQFGVEPAAVAATAGLRPHPRKAGLRATGRGLAQLRRLERRPRAEPGDGANTAEPVAKPSAEQRTPQRRPSPRRPFIVGLYVVCVWLLTASIWTNATGLAGDYAASARAELGQAPLVLLAMLLRG
jgi:hypothetical protein